jgi:hypothetical protein
VRDTEGYPQTSKCGQERRGLVGFVVQLDGWVSG